MTILPYEPVIGIVQDVCDYFAEEYSVDKVTLIITSGARCYIYNRSEDVGSNNNGQHPRACAIDFKIKINGVQVPPNLIYKYLDAKYPNELGLGLYNSFNHVDTRPIKARW